MNGGHCIPPECKGPTCCTPSATRKTRPPGPKLRLRHLTRRKDPRGRPSWVGDLLVLGRQELTPPSHSHRFCTRLTPTLGSSRRTADHPVLPTLRSQWKGIGALAVAGDASTVGRPQGIAQGVRRVGAAGVSVQTGVQMHERLPSASSTTQYAGAADFADQASPSVEHSPEPMLGFVLRDPYVKVPTLLELLLGKRQRLIGVMRILPPDSRHLPAVVDGLPADDVCAEQRCVERCQLFPMDGVES